MWHCNWQWCQIVCIMQHYNWQQYQHGSICDTLICSGAKFGVKVLVYFVSPLLKGPAISDK